MNDELRIDLLLERQLAETPISRAPDQLRADIASATSRQRQRPPWLTSLKEPPMRYRSRVAVGSPTARVAALAAVTMLVAILSAGALVAVAQSLSPGPLEVPTAPRPAWVMGTVEPGGSQPTLESRVVDGVETERSHQTDLPIQMDDPRLTGTMSQVFTLFRHPVSDDDDIRVFTGEYRIENEGGGWEGTVAGMERGTESWHTVTDSGVLVGSGAYEGLTAYLVFDWTWEDPPATVTGTIFRGDLPPVVTFEDLLAE